MADKNILSSLFVLSLFFSFPNLCLGDNKECCSSVLLDSDQAVHNIQGDRLGFYSQLGTYGARPAYRQQGGVFFLFYHKEEKKWIDSQSFYGASLNYKIENDIDSLCLEASNNWSFYNGSDLMYSEMLRANCSKIENVCCQEIKISSANSESKTDNQTFYHWDPNKSLGNFKSIGMNNGRYVYQKENTDMYLEYGDGYWLVSTGVGKTSGHIINQGGSVCPEHIENEWQISDKNTDGAWIWKDDPLLKITCVKVKQIEDITYNHLPNENGPMAQPHIQIEPSGQARSYSDEAIVFGCISMLFFSMLIAFFAKKFYGAWGRGAHGKQLLFETMDIK